MSVPDRIAAAAEALVGTPFRLHGRSPDHGLDCIGLVAVALRAAGLAAVPPEGYGLRNAGIARWLGAAEASGLARATGPLRRGDIAVFAPGPAQSHLGVALGDGRIVHAHAGMGQTVIEPVPPAWPLLHHWRAGSTSQVRN